MTPTENERCCDAWPHADDEPCRWKPTEGLTVGINLHSDYEDLLVDWDDD